MIKDEHTLQVYCVAWFRVNYPNELIYAIPNGGHRAYSTAKRLKAEGTTSGIPDLHIPTPMGEYHGLYIEMKYGYNKPSEAQKKIMAYLNNKGYLCAVCWSLDEFMQTINNYYKL
jgi:hypothetical protein